MLHPRHMPVSRPGTPGPGGFHRPPSALAAPRCRRDHRRARGGAGCLCSGGAAAVRHPAAAAAGLCARRPRRC